MAVELISTASLVAIISALGFAIFDSNKDRRPFWTGFFICGIGFIFATFSTSMQASNEAMSAFLCNLGGVQPEADVVFAPAPNSGNPNNITLAMTQSIYPGVVDSFAYRQSVSQAVPVLSAFVSALAGGIATTILSQRQIAPSGRRRMTKQSTQNLFVAAFNFESCVGVCLSLTAMSLNVVIKRNA